MSGMPFSTTICILHCSIFSLVLETVTFSRGKRFIMDACLECFFESFSPLRLAALPSTVISFLITGCFPFTCLSCWKPLNNFHCKVIVVTVSPWCCGN